MTDTPADGEWQCGGKGLSAAFRLPRQGTARGSSLSSGPTWPEGRAVSVVCRRRQIGEAERTLLTTELRPYYGRFLREFLTLLGAPAPAPDATIPLLLAAIDGATVPGWAESDSVAGGVQDDDREGER